MRLSSPLFYAKESLKKFFFSLSLFFFFFLALAAAAAAAAAAWIQFSCWPPKGETLADSYMSLI